MKNLIGYAIALSLLVTPVLLNAQSRDLRSERIVLDDNNGNSIVVQTPAGPITGGTLTIPDPGGAGQFLISNPSGGSQSVSGDLLPGTDDTYDLGSGASRWQDIFGSGNFSIGGQARFVETGGGTDYVGFQAPAAVAANQIWTLPAADGSAGQALTTDGSGVLSWAASGGTVSRNATLIGDGSGGSPLGINLANSNTWTSNQTFSGGFLITANTRIALTNSDNNARDIRFQEPSGSGSQYVGLRAPAVAGNSNYVFPAAIGTAGQVLSLATVNGGGDSAQLGWITPGGGGGTVSTNATLNGDGSGGSPLGLNLANSNTWTSNQTFAGSFLITSNARIALVNNDNNARDIRFQEPSGSGSQYVGLRAPGVASNSNYVFPAAIGTAGQVLTLATVNGFGDSATLGWATPVAEPVFSRSDVTVTAGANNLLASAGGSLIRITGFTGGAGAFNISGISGGVDGKMIVILNQTGQNATVNFEDFGETAANRIVNTAGGTANTIGSGNYILVYDGGANRWEVVIYKN